MQAAVETESQTADMEGGPPAHWLARVRSGPPAHWLEDIRRRAANPDRLETFDVTVQSPESEGVAPLEGRREESQSARKPAEASASSVEVPDEKAPVEALKVSDGVRDRKAPAETSISGVPARGEVKPPMTSASSVGSQRQERPAITSTSSAQAPVDAKPVVNSAPLQVRREAIQADISPSEPGVPNTKAPLKPSPSRLRRMIQPIVAVRRTELPQAKASERPRIARQPVAQAITARSQPLSAESHPDTVQSDVSKRPSHPWPALPDELHQRLPTAEPEHAGPAAVRGYSRETRRAATPEPQASYLAPSVFQLPDESIGTPHIAGSVVRPPAPNVWPELPPDNWPVADDEAVAQREREHLQQLQREQEGSR